MMPDHDDTTPMIGVTNGNEHKQPWQTNRLPFVALGLLLFILASTSPHTIGIITASLYLLLIAVAHQYAAAHPHHQQRRSCFKTILLVLLGIGTFFTSTLVIVGFTGLSPSPFPSSFPRACVSPLNSCAMLCTHTSNQSLFHCDGRHRVSLSQVLPVPRLNASSLRQAGEMVQQDMVDTGLFVDATSYMSGGNESVAVYIVGHGVTPFWGFTDSIGVLVLCSDAVVGSGTDSGSDNSEHSDYEVWIVSQSKLGVGDFGANGKRIQTFARNLQGVGGKQRSGTSGQCGSGGSGGGGGSGGSGGSGASGASGASGKANLS